MESTKLVNYKYDLIIFPFDNFVTKYTSKKLRLQLKTIEQKNCKLISTLIHIS